jgi:hypothetical protein
MCCSVKLYVDLENFCILPDVLLMNLRLKGLIWLDVGCKSYEERGGGGIKSTRVFLFIQLAVR